MSGITRKIEFKDATLPTISVCMIVKNEEENLKKLLPVLKNVADEIIIIDTGSSDRTKDIARIYTEKVHDFPWINHFSKARNESISHATKDYILWCFHPDTLITTESGLKKISEIKVGEKVLTHTGIFKSVTKLYERDFNGEACKIKTTAFNDDIIVTDNHEFYATKAYKCKCGIKFCKPDCNKQWSKRNLKKTGTITHQCKHGYKNYEYKFTPIKNLEQGDILSFPKFKINTNNIEYLNMTHYNGGHNNNKLLDKIKIEPDLLRLFGYFLAEGCITNSGITFSFHSEEDEYHVDVITLMEKFFNIKGAIYKRDKRTSVVFNSTDLSKFFKELFGGKQPIRKIPEFVFSTPLNYIADFIKGYYYGDGGQNPDSFAFTSCNFNMINQIRILLTGFGILGEIMPYKEKNAWKLRVGGKQREIFESIINEKHKSGYKNMYNKNFYVADDYIHFPIKTIEKIPYSGKVYNLEVEDAHTYVANYALCHNCDGDDLITKQDIIKLKYHLKIHGGTAVFLTLVDKRLDREFHSLQLRVFPNFKNLKFAGRIHEQISFDVEKSGIKYSTCDVKIYHMGYSSQEKVIDKLKRNAAIGEEELIESPNDFMLNLTLSRTYLGLNNLEKARPLIEKTLEIIANGKTGVSKENEFLAYLGKVTLLCYENKNSEAIELLKKAETYFSNDKLLKLTLGELSFKNKDYKTAYKKLLGLKDGSFSLGLSPIDVTGMVRQLSVYLLVSSLNVGDFDTTEFCIRKMINDPEFRMKR